MPSAEAGWRRAWPGLRAGLILCVVLVQLADATPLPELKPRDLNHPIARDEVKRWTGILNEMGHPITEDELVEAGLLVGQSATRLRKAVLGPFAPFRRITGTGQSWGLFAYPDPYAGRLVVRGRSSGGDWEELYRAPGEDDGRLGDRLRFRRVRGIYDDAGDRPHPGAVWKRFTRWLAQEVFLERPDLDEVEVRIDLVRVRLPGEGSAPPEKVRHARLELREEIL